MTEATTAPEETVPAESTATPTIPYPDNPAMQALYRSPMLMYRLGLGPLVGQLFMVITTTGRKSGEPRRAVVEYHSYDGRKYALAAWPNSDWYRNLQANPRATIQTADGVEYVIARRLMQDAELADVYDNVFAKASDELKQFWQAMGFEMDREEFLGNKDDYYLLAFELADVTDDAPAQPPLEEDLRWVLPAMLAGLVALVALVVLGRRRKR